MGKPGVRAQHAHVESEAQSVAIAGIINTPDTGGQTGSALVAHTV